MDLTTEDKHDFGAKWLREREIQYAIERSFPDTLRGGHSHHCPTCYGDVPCERYCTIEPDLSDAGNEVYRGATTDCDECRESLPTHDGYEWIVLRIREGGPAEVYPFMDEASARSNKDILGQQWSDTYLCRIVR